MKTVLKLMLALAVLVVGGGVGGYFALRKPDIPYATLEQKYQKADDRYLDLPSGVRAHYRIEGRLDGPTILLVHPFGADLDIWSQWVRELGGDYRLISVDLPGHGLTRAPADYQPTIAAFADYLEEFAAAAGLGGVIVAGNSVGGNSAWLLAVRHPARVATLVLLAPAGWRDAKAGPAFPLSLFLDPRTQPYLVRIDYKPILATLRSGYARPALFTDTMLDRYAELARAPGHRMLIARMLAPGAEGEASQAKLATITAPTLILWGEEDAMAPVANARRFAQAIPDATVKTYANVGHFAQVEAAAPSAADVKAFLTERTLAGAALAGTPPPAVATASPE